jgi:hypothetical protein
MLLDIKEIKNVLLSRRARQHPGDLRIGRRDTKTKRTEPVRLYPLGHVPARLHGIPRAGRGREHRHELPK